MIDLIPIDVSTFGILGCVVAIALGGFLRGFLGFGAALLMVPILSSILTPAVGLVIMYLVEVPTVLYLMPPALKKGKVKIVLPMILALLVTIPIGFYFVVALDPETIRIVISVMVILMVALLASGWKPRGEISLLTMIIGGCFSGLVNGAAGVGGPPFVTVLMARNDDAEITRSNIIITMGCMSLLTTLTQFFYGMMTVNLLIISIFAFPIYIGFTWLGAKYFNSSGNSYFRKAALVMLILIAIITIIINI
ncbi:MAG: hypothetical protein CMN37_00935 [SAR116 cluster bacterium]|nr:hypothetical protein [SAR116 cluster bacterium]